MRIFKLIIVFLGVIVLMGCDGNYRNVKVYGVVLDSKLKIPIKNEKLVITCWVYDTEIWESKPIVKNVFTDVNGKYFVEFESGEVIDIFLTSVGYKNYNFSITLEKSSNEINIELDAKLE